MLELLWLRDVKLLELAFVAQNDKSDRELN